MENKKLKIKLSDGRELIAEVYNYDGKHEEVCIYIETEISTQDICLIKEHEREQGEIEVFVWGDSEDEDYTECYKVKKREEWIEETCPYCDYLNEFKMSEAKDYKNGKKIIVCQNCGAISFVCSLCDGHECGKCRL